MTYFAVFFCFFCPRLSFFTNTLQMPPKVTLVTVSKVENKPQPHLDTAVASGPHFYAPYVGVWSTLPLGRLVAKHWLIIGFKRKINQSGLVDRKNLPGGGRATQPSPSQTAPHLLVMRGAAPQTPRGLHFRILHLSTSPDWLIWSLTG